MPNSLFSAQKRAMSVVVLLFVAVILTSDVSAGVPPFDRSNTTTKSHTASPSNEKTASETDSETRETVSFSESDLQTGSLQTESITDTGSNGRRTGSPSFSLSESPSESLSASTSRSRSGSPSGSQTPSGSHSHTVTSSASGTQSRNVTESDSPSEASRTESPSEEHTASSSESQSLRSGSTTVTDDVSGSDSGTVTDTLSTSGSVTETDPVTDTAALSSTVSGTDTETDALVSVSRSSTASVSHRVTPSRPLTVSRTLQVTDTISTSDDSPSETMSQTTSRSGTPSPSASTTRSRQTQSSSKSITETSPTVTHTVPPSTSLSETVSQTVSEQPTDTARVTDSAVETQSTTGTNSERSGSETPSEAASVSKSLSITRSRATKSKSGSVASVSDSASDPITLSRQTFTVSGSGSESITGTESGTETASPSPDPTASGTASPQEVSTTQTQPPSSTVEVSESDSLAQTISGSGSQSPSESSTMTESSSLSISGSFSEPTPSEPPTDSDSLSLSTSSTRTGTRSATGSTSASDSDSPSETPSAIPSTSVSESPSESSTFTTTASVSASVSHRTFTPRHTLTSSVSFTESDTVSDSNTGSPTSDETATGSETLPDSKSRSPNTASQSTTPPPTGSRSTSESRPSPSLSWTSSESESSSSTLSTTQSDDTPSRSRSRNTLSMSGSPTPGPTRSTSATMSHSLTKSIGTVSHSKGTVSASKTISSTVTRTQSPPTETKSQSPTMRESDSRGLTVSESVDETVSHHGANSSYSYSGTTSVSESLGPSPTMSFTPDETASFSPSPGTKSDTGSETQIVTVSDSESMSSSPSHSETPTPSKLTGSPSSSQTMTITHSPSDSKTPTPSFPTPTAGKSITPIITTSPSISLTPSRTASQSPSPSASDSRTVSPSVSRSYTSPSASITVTPAKTGSMTSTLSGSGSLPITGSPSKSLSGTPSLPITASPTLTVSASRTPSLSHSVSRSGRTQSESRSLSTRSRGLTFSSSITVSHTRSPVPTLSEESPTTTDSPTEEITSSPSMTESTSVTHPTFPISISVSDSGSDPVTATEVLTLSETASHHRVSMTQPKSVTLTRSASESESGSSTDTHAISDTVSVSPSERTESVESSPTVSIGESLSSTLTASSTQSETLSVQDSPTDSIRLSGSTTMTLKESSTGSISDSETESPRTESIRESVTVSESMSRSHPITKTRPLTLTASVSDSVSASSTTSVSGTESPSADQTASVESPSLSPSSTVTVDDGESATSTPSMSQSVAVTLSALETMSTTPSEPSPTDSPSLSSTSSMSLTGDATASGSVSSSASVPTPTDSEHITQSLERSYTRPETGSESALSPSDTRTFTRPPTVTPSVSPSSSSSPSDSSTVRDTFTATEGASVSETRSNTLVATDSDTVSESSTRSASETASRTVSGGTASESGTYSDVGDTSTTSYTLSESRSLLPTRSPSPDATASESSSESMTYNTRTHPASPSGTLSQSDSESPTMTQLQSETPSESITPTVSLASVQNSARYTVYPSGVDNVWEAGRRLHLILEAVPLDRANDEAFLLDVDKPCQDPITNASHPEKRPLQYVGGNGVRQNWTIVVAVPGVMRLCYFSAITSKMFSIAQPYNITVIAWAFPTTTRVVTNVHGDGVALSWRVIGGNASRDGVRLVKFGEQCNGFSTTVAVLSIVSYTASTMTASSPLDVSPAGDYTACYRSFSLPELWIRLTSGPLRTVPKIVRVQSPLVQSGFGMTLTVNGFGLTVSDRMYVTNDTTEVCGGSRMSSPGRVVVPASIVLPVSGNHRDSRFTVDRVTFSGRLFACFRGNTSKSYTLGATLFAEPIAATYFTPNASGDAWAAGSMVELAFGGNPFIDSTYDRVTLVPNASSCDDHLTGQLLDSYQPNGININTFRAVVSTSSTYAVCYGANTSTVPVLVGSILVRDRFYAASSSFASGIALNRALRLDMFGVGINASDPVWLVKYNATHPSDTCTNALEPSAVFMMPTQVFSNNSVTFVTSNSGYHTVCLYTALGPVLMGDVLPIFADPPSAFTPATVGATEAFTLNFTGGRGMDLTFGDSVYPCDLPNPQNLAPSSPRVATGTVATLGEVSLCFRTAIVAGNGAPSVTRLAQRLVVSPVVTSVVVVPPRTTVGGQFNVTATGVGLTSRDTLYACNTSDPGAHLRPNTTAFSVARNAAGWTVTALMAGAFDVCYAYATSPAFAPGAVERAPQLAVDPVVFSATPSTIEADFPTPIILSGVDLHRLSRIFVNLNGTGCDAANPFAIDWTADNATENGVTITGSVPRRGIFELCLIGDSGVPYAAEPAITVVPRLSSLSAAQTGSIVGANSTEYYSNFPIVVSMQGGGLDYALDTFFAVRGAVCEVTSRTALTSVAPPQGATPSLQLSFRAPIEGTYRLCYQFGSDAPTLFASSQFDVINGLVYRNSTIGLRGPYTTSTSVVEFSFALGARTATKWTAFQSASTAVAVPLLEIPFGQMAFRARILDRNGLVQYVLTLPHAEPGSTAFCGALSASVADTDPVRQFARSIILLHNFRTLQCQDVTDTTQVATLLRTTLTLIEGDQSLVTDAAMSMGTLTGVATTQRDSAQRYDDSTLLLTATANTLQRPVGEIDDALLGAHVSAMDTISLSIAQLNADPTTVNPSKAQALALGVIERLQLVSSRHCDRQLLTVYNSTASAIALAAVGTPVGSSLTASLQTGYGVTTTPVFASASASRVCVMGSLFTENIFPQRASTATARRLMQSVAPATTPIESDIPDFTIPLLTYSLPQSSGASPLAATPTVRFNVEMPQQTRPPQLPGQGWEVQGDFYRFVPDGGNSNSGEWVRDYDARPTVDSEGRQVTIEYNTTRQQAINSRNEPVTASNFLVLSGRVLVRPVVILPPDTATDIPLAVLVGALVLLHLLTCCIGHLVDTYRDARHEPDVDRMTQPENNITMHRFIYVGVRKPHDQISTWQRATAFFTFVFVAAFFSMLVLLSSPWEPAAWYNIPLGLVASVAATPFATVTRIALRTQLWDYASGISAAVGILSMAVAVPLIGVYIATLICFCLGVIAFFVSVGIFKARWGFELQPKPGPFPKVFGVGWHVVFELGAVLYLLYLALLHGTPKKFQDELDFWQVLWWSLALDAVLLEPVKNRLFLWLRAVVVSMQSERDARKASFTPQVAPTVTYTAGKALPPPTPTGSEASFEEYELDDETGDLSFADVDEETYRSTRRASVGGPSEFEDVGSDFAEDDSSVIVDGATPRSSVDDLSELGSADDYDDIESAPGREPYNYASPQAAGPSDAAYRNRATRFRGVRSSASVGSRASNPVDFSDVDIDDLSDD